MAWNKRKPHARTKESQPHRYRYVAFDIEKEQELHDMTKWHVLRITITDIHIIEFQKRGLSHRHLLLILADEAKLRDSEAIHTLVCTKLLDFTVDLVLHEIVKSSMIHKPCGSFNPNSSSMVNGTCYKAYPKQF